MVKVSLGDAVKDSISGFVGIATGRAEYMTGCVQIQVTEKNLPQMGKRPVECWIDEQRLYVTKAGAHVLLEENIQEAPAGPQNVPPKKLAFCSQPECDGEMLGGVCMKCG